MAFPGGRSQKEETDFDAATREVVEEIGFDLRIKSIFHFAGRMNDRFEQK